ncbi:hypothetical protein [Sphingomonas endolithica]|uniref:hypothetical protein n=1 Tax=Sphingomonas endolithica TaxID=2972485 RepID=UPI0021B0046B|nr:hypothetical protein [Sphingomonas sp. ZFBP2030]
MTDERDMDLPPEDLPVGSVDAAGMAIDPEEIARPEQPPIDDASGGQGDGGGDIDDVSTDELSVQGGA